MKFIAEAIVDGSFPQLGIRLGKQKLPDHFQFCFHLESRKGFFTILMDRLFKVRSQI